MIQDSSESEGPGETAFLDRQMGGMEYWSTAANGSAGMLGFFTSLLPPGKGQHPLESRSYNHLHRRRDGLCFHGWFFRGDGGRVSLHWMPRRHIWGCHVPRSTLWIPYSVCVNPGKEFFKNQLLCYKIGWSIMLPTWQGLETNKQKNDKTISAVRTWGVFISWLPSLLSGRDGAFDQERYLFQSTYKHWSHADFTPRSALASLISPNGIRVHGEALQFSLWLYYFLLFPTQLTLYLTHN